MAAEYEVNIKINTQQIERELKKVDKAVNNIGKGKKGGRASGLGLMPGDELKRLQQSRIYLGQAVQSIDRLAKIQDRRARSLNKINELEAKGLSVGRLRRQLVKATTEQSRRRLGSAEKEFRVLEKSIRLEQSKLRILKEQRKGFASSPVRGTRTMMGSPAQIAAAARAGGATSPIRGGLNFPGSPAFLAGARASRTPFGPSFPTGGAFSPVRGGFNFPGSPIALAGASVSRTPFGPSFPTGGAALPIRGSISMPGSPIAVQAAKATNLRALKVEASWGKALGELQETAEMFKLKDAKIKQSWGTALAELSETAALIQVRSQQASAGLTGQSSPIGGATNIPGSPAFLRRQRRRKTLEQVGLGAGFPLLFGGGAGSVLGGGLGGLTGSFGAQIAFSAFGQQIDQFVAGMVNAGKALTSVGGAADFMAEKSLFSSDAMQFRIEKLIEEGQVTEAAALMTQEMAKKVGGTGLKALKDLGTEASKMGKLFGTVMLRIQAFMAQALTPLIKLINSAIGGMVAQNQLDQMLAEAGSPERRAAILARSQELRGTKKQGRVSSTRGDFTMEMLQTLQSEFPSIIPEGAAIVPTQLETLQAAAGSKKKDKLPGLKAEREKLERLLDLEEKRFGFELKGDRAAIARMKASEKVAKIAEEIKKIKASDLTADEKREALAAQGIENARVNLELGFQLAQIEKDRAAQIDELRIKTEEMNPVYQQQLALAQGIADTFGTTMVQAFDAMVAGTERFDVAIRRLVAGALSDMAKQLFRIFVIEQAIRSIGAAFAPLPIFGSGGGVDQFGRGTLGPNYGIRQFANGGRPPVGRPSLVGERGPELFVPDRSGTIIPNHAMGSTSVVVNVDASGTEVQGNQGGAEQLGRLIGAAVQAELIKQKRPGGLLTR